MSGPCRSLQIETRKVSIAPTKNDSINLVDMLGQSQEHPSRRCPFFLEGEARTLHARASIMLEGAPCPGICLPSCAAYHNRQLEMPVRSSLALQSSGTWPDTPRHSELEAVDDSRLVPEIGILRRPQGVIGLGLV